MPVVTVVVNVVRMFLIFMVGCCMHRRRRDDN
jgi:hypothetical protein